MNFKTKFFKSFKYDQLYTMDQIGKAFGKNRHYVSTLFTENKIKEDSKDGKSKLFWGYTIQKLTDECIFDKYLVEPTPTTPRPKGPYMPTNFDLF